MYFNIFKPIDSKNIFLTPIKTHKRRFFNSLNLDDVKIFQGEYYDYFFSLHLFEPQKPENISGILTPEVYNELNSKKISKGYFIPFDLINHSYFENFKLNVDLQDLNHFYKKQIFNLIYHLYYQFIENIFHCYSPVEFPKFYRYLSKKLTLINIPQKIYGDEIKPGSFEFWNTTHNIFLYDDGKGNIRDKSIETNFLDNYENLISYWSFDEGYRYANRIYSLEERNRSYVHENLVLKNVTFRESKYLFGLKFLGENNETPSYGYAKHRNEYNFRKNDEFCISFWIKLPEKQKDIRGGFNTVLEKFFGYKGYPFSILISNQNAKTSSDEDGNGYLIFRRWDGQKLFYLVSLFPINDNEWHHVVLNKVGNDISLYIDNVLQDYGNDSFLNDNVHNDSPIFFGVSARPKGYNLKFFDKLFVSGMLIDGGEFTSQSVNNAEEEYYLTFDEGDENDPLIDYYIIPPPFLSEIEERSLALTVGGFLDGEIDEVRIYSRGLTKNEILDLYSKGRPNIVGNIIYSHGNIIFTDYQRYYNLFDGEYYFQFNATHTIYQYEFLCEILPNEFLCSYNKSLIKDVKNGTLIDNFYNEYFTPYITKIGFFDSEYNLIAVAKLARPIKKAENAPLTFLIRLDV